VLYICTEFEADSSFRSKVIRGSQISPGHRPPSWGAGRLKFNQLEMVTTFTYKPIKFRVIVVTDPQTHATRPPQTVPITIHCAAV